MFNFTDIQAYCLQIILLYIQLFFFCSQVIFLTKHVFYKAKGYKDTNNELAS